MLCCATPVGAMGASINSNNAMAGTANEMNSVGNSPSGSSATYGNPGSIATSTQMLSNLVSVHRGLAPGLVSHYNTTPVFDVYANVDRRDLGGVGAEIQKLMAETKTKLPSSSQLTLRGQFETMQTSFFRLGLGMIASRRIGLLVDGRQFPILARPVHHPHRLAGRHGRHRVDAVRHPDHLQRSPR